MAPFKVLQCHGERLALSDQDWLVGSSAAARLGASQAITASATRAFPAGEDRIGDRAHCHESQNREKYEYSESTPAGSALQVKRRGLAFQIKGSS